MLKHIYINPKELGILCLSLSESMVGFISFFHRWYPNNNDKIKVDKQANATIVMLFFILFYLFIYFLLQWNASPREN